MGSSHQLSTHLDIRLVCLSVALAVVASYVALDLTRRSADASGRAGRLWIAGGGATMGVGIWSMHFVGMLALRMEMPVSYNQVLVALSLVAAVAGATVSLAVVTRAHVSRRGLLSAAAFMGFAIAAMHYIGMASMQMAAEIQWQALLVLASLAVAFLASLTALWLLVRISNGLGAFGFGRRAGAAILLGLGVAGLHYTAMAASSFSAGPEGMSAHQGLSTDALVVVLVVGAIAMLAVLIGGAAVDQRRAALSSDLTIAANLARGLCHVGDTRGLVCHAIQELTTADYVLLLQPEEDGNRVLTASAGISGNLGASTLRDQQCAQSTPSSAAQTVLSGLCGNNEVGLGLHQLPGGETVLYEPLMLERVQVGILAVGWSKRMRRLPDRTATLLSMLAAESAVAIDRESLVSRLRYLARCDELTGLFNRRVLGEELERELGAASRHGRDLSIVMLDLDHFKRYNDTYGHQAGDILLKGAATAWSAQLRTADTIARYGGEEFLAILPDCTTEAAIDTADRLREAVPGGAGCSAGVATLEGLESAAQLIARADRALYDAKAAGRDCTKPARPRANVAQQADP